MTLTALNSTPWNAEKRATEDQAWRFGSFSAADWAEEIESEPGVREVFKTGDLLDEGVIQSLIVFFDNGSHSETWNPHLAEEILEVEEILEHEAWLHNGGAE